jgi:hypothetical protein
MAHLDSLLSFVFGKWEFEEMTRYLAGLLLFMMAGYALFVVYSIVKFKENNRVTDKVFMGLKLSVQVLISILFTGLGTLLVGGGLLFILEKVFSITYNGEQRFSLLLITWGLIYLGTIIGMFLRAGRKK